MSASGDIVKRLELAAATAANDDRTLPSTESRARHFARYEAMIDAAVEIKLLRAKLRLHGRHLRHCAKTNPIIGPCDCGLDAALGGTAPP